MVVYASLSPLPWLPVPYFFSWSLRAASKGRCSYEHKFTLSPTLQGTPKVKINSNPHTTGRAPATLPMTALGIIHIFLLAPRKVPGQSALRPQPLLGASPESPEVAPPCHILVGSGKKRRPHFPQGMVWTPGCSWGGATSPPFCGIEDTVQGTAQRNNRNKHQAGVSCL